MDAPIQSPMSAHRGSSATTTSMSQQSSTAQKFVPPPPPQHRQPSTESFIRDLNLVAEAAKRAQMACLMRDMESIGIS